MGFLIGLLTVVMVLDCLILIFLVLIQLPKKEAGAGLAFGGSATDALFGAGSGTVLTKITRYAATTFFVLAVVLSIMQSAYHSRGISTFERQLGKPAGPPAGAMTPPTPPAPPAGPITMPSATNAPVFRIPTEATNLPTAAPTNPAPQ